MMVFFIPCIYCLTSNQKQTAYEKIFNHLLSIESSHFNIKYILEDFTSDFKLSSINVVVAIDPNIQITVCFSRYSQLIILFIDQTRITIIQKKKFWEPNQWFSGAVGLALISPSSVESVWTNNMDNYVCQELCRYSIELSNVYDNIRNNLPRTNNATEGYNYRMSNIFSFHPHTYEFVRRLKDKHEFQHHKSGEA